MPPICSQCAPTTSDSYDTQKYTFPTSAWRHFWHIGRNKMYIKRPLQESIWPLQEHVNAHWHLSHIAHILQSTCQVNQSFNINLFFFISRQYAQWKMQALCKLNWITNDTVVYFHYKYPVITFKQNWRHNEPKSYLLFNIIISSIPGRRTIHLKTNKTNRCYRIQYHILFKRGFCHGWMYHCVTWNFTNMYHVAQNVETQAPSIWNIRMSHYWIQCSIVIMVFASDALPTYVHVWIIFLQTRWPIQIATWGFSNSLIFCHQMAVRSPLKINYSELLICSRAASFLQ